MKTILNLLLVLATIGLSSCSIETISTVHNRFVQFEDYTFEVTKGPNEFGDIVVTIVNRKGLKFRHNEVFNEYEPLRRRAYADMYGEAWSNDLIGSTVKTISIHKTSGLQLIEIKKDVVETGSPYLNAIIGIPDNSIDKIFESASNFFNIR